MLTRGQGENETIMDRMSVSSGLSRTVADVAVLPVAATIDDPDPSARGFLTVRLMRTYV